MENRLTLLLLLSLLGVAVFGFSAIGANLNSAPNHVKRR